MNARGVSGGIVVGLIAIFSGLAFSLLGILGYLDSLAFFFMFTLRFPISDLEQFRLVLVGLGLVGLIIGMIIMNASHAIARNGAKEARFQMNAEPVTSEEQEATVESYINCPKCHAKMTGASAFCGMCGEPFT